jgi:transcriptional regulator with XRE-family HTH domain
MSSRKITKNASSEFIGRFVEVCGSSQPSDIAQLLNISYQAAKNYLQGRLPDSTVLLSIAEKTPYSIHWLLTGNGEKFVNFDVEKDTLILSDRLQTLIKEECRKNVSEILKRTENAAQGKVIVLKQDDIKEEKVFEESNALPLKIR